MNRLFGVVLLYLTRPLCWVLFAIIVTFLWFGWSWRSETYENYSPGGFPNSAYRIFNNQSLVEAQNAMNAAVGGQAGKSVAVDYGSLAQDLQYRHFGTDGIGVPKAEILSQEELTERLKKLTFPTSTRWLATGSWEIQQSTIEQIGNIKSLEHVELLIANSDGVPLDLSPLAKLVNLKSLNLGQIINVDLLMPLKTLPELKSLTIGNHQFVTAKNMREIAEIKSLKQLFLPDVANNPQAMAALAELKSSSLKQVYVAIPPFETAKLQSISSSIPSLNVRSSQYFPMRAWGCGGVLWMMMVINLLAIHFCAMFTVPAAELTPGYRVTQRRVAWTVMLGLILLGAGLMWSCRVDLGLAVAMTAAALFLSVFSNIRIQTITKLGTAAERWYGLLFLASIAAVMGWAWQQPLEADHLLARPPWWGVVFLFAVATFLGVRCNKMLNALCRDRVAAGNEPILSFFDLQAANLKLNTQRSGDQVETYQRISNWISGIGVLILIGVLALWFWPANWFSSMIGSELIQYIPIFAFYAVLMIMLKWWKRVPFLATMITRPPNRSSQIKEIFLGVAVDFARALPLMLAAALVLGSRVADKFGSTAETGLLVFLLTAGIIGMFYALTLVAMTVQSTRWIFVSCILLILCSSVFSGGVVTSYLTSRSWVAESGMFITFSTLGVLILAMSVATTMLMWRRYHKIEWGNLLS